MSLDWREIAEAGRHPTQIAVLELLDDIPELSWSPNRMSRAIGENLGDTSYHVRVLAGENLLTLTDTQPRRGAVEHYYELSGRARNGGG